MAAGLDPKRAAEVIGRPDTGPGKRGSGYLVATGLVLTAAHVLVDAGTVDVRFNADQPGEWHARAEVAWSEPSLDLAILRIAESSVYPIGLVPEVASTRYGRITRPPVRCEMIGFPRFKLRSDSIRQAADGKPSQYRDSHHALGTATSWSHLREGTLEVNVDAPERDTDPDRSPWEGMSGAAVFSDECLIGIIGKHHRTDGLGTLTAYRIDQWYHHLTDEQISVPIGLLGLPRRADELSPIGTQTQAPVSWQPRQLPATTSVFTGRAQEVKRLVNLSMPGPGHKSPSTVVLSAIGGMAGIGKTELAIYAAHQMAHRFPDGQLFIDLHGYTPGMSPLDPGDALDQLLRSLGIPPHLIPEDPQMRAGLYRSRLGGTKTLVILDNASSTSQVRPLLPGDSTCLVLVTSRKRLAGLDDAYSLSLDTLPGTDAIRLLRRVAGRNRVKGDHPAATELVELCGYMPLAIRIVAGRLRRHKLLSIEDIVDQLRDENSRLQYLSDDERNLVAVFSSSYVALPVAEQELFRYLSLIPGPDFDAYAAANLINTEHRRAERLLESLLDHNLLTQQVRRRYSFHDLIRMYARSLSEQDRGAGRDAALSRLLDYYQYTARAADDHLARHSRFGPKVSTDVALTRAPEVASRASALAWMRAERANLIAAAEEVTARPQRSRVVALAAALGNFLLQEGPWPQAIELHKAAVEAARAAADRGGEGAAVWNLGSVIHATGDFLGAADLLGEALEIFQEVADRLSEADAFWELGRVRRMTGDYPAAAELLEGSLKIFRELGHLQGQADALQDLGRVRRMTGDYPAAAELLEHALGLCEELGHLQGQADALQDLGRVRRMTGDYPAAAELLEQALVIFQELNSSQSQADALWDLGRVRRMTGDYPEATNLLQRALKIFTEIGDRLGEANALHDLGRVRLLTGDYLDAARLLEDALEISHSLTHRLGEAYCLQDLGRVRRMTGDYPGATNLLERALESFQELGSRHGEANTKHDLGCVQHALMNYAKAMRLLQDSLAVFRDIGDRQNEAQALISLGSLMSDTSSARDALPMFQQSLAIAHQLNSPMDKAIALETTARCLAKLGERSAAAAYVREAVEIYHSIGAGPEESAIAYLTTLES
jgi:tetratricopeptide (TPR) repeat protein